MTTEIACFGNHVPCCGPVSSTALDGDVKRLPPDAVVPARAFPSPISDAKRQICERAFRMKCRKRLLQAMSVFHLEYGSPLVVDFVQQGARGRDPYDRLLLGNGLCGYCRRENWLYQENQ